MKVHVLVIITLVFLKTNGIEMATSTEIYRQLIDDSLYELDCGAQYLFINSAIRSIMQTACICLLEHSHATVDDIEKTSLPGLAVELRSGTDGLFPRLLSTAIPLVRQAGWPSCCTPWFQCDQNGSIALNIRAENWVRHRNNFSGHGVVAQNTMEEAMVWLPVLAQDLVRGLSDILPSVEVGGRLYLESPSLEARRDIASLRFAESSPVVVRSITMRGNIWRVLYQTLDPRSSVESFFDIEDSSPLIRLTRIDARRYRTVCVGIPDDPGSWNPAVNLPNRQTSAFAGRKPELDHLTEWLDDTDSRVCNVYGEGGIGKTTLVLELLNSILAEDVPAPAWRPDVICFFSAKETRWGPDGLQLIKGVMPAVEDAAREIARVFEDPLDKSWYEGQAKSIIDKAASILVAGGCGRNTILLILDNAETLTRNQTDEEELGRMISYLGKRLCRVLVTSRRRERVEAFPLQVPPMDDETGEFLLRKLAKEYNSTPLISAGSATLRKVTRQFGGRPILLDVFSRLIGQYGYSIDRGIESVLGMAKSDLGDFLYQDAWARMAPSTQEALLVLGQLGSSVTEELFKWTCSETTVSYGALLGALEETRFGTSHDYGQRLELVFDPSARAFLGERFRRAHVETRGRVERAVGNIRKKNDQYLRAEHTEVNDRVRTAFRSEAAKAAHRAVDQGDFQEAVIWYEEAIKVDSGNAALLDRFALFLSRDLRDFSRAAIVAKQACDADPKDADAHFTAGLIAARTGDVPLTDRLISQALSLGKAPHLCCVQRAWARSHCIQKQLKSKSTNLDEITKLDAVARQLLTQSKIINPATSKDYKHNDERERIIGRLNDFFEKVETLRTYRRGTQPRV